MNPDLSSHCQTWVCRGAPRVRERGIVDCDDWGSRDAGQHVIWGRLRGAELLAC